MLVYRLFHEVMLHSSLITHDSNNNYGEDNKYMGSNPKEKNHSDNGSYNTTVILISNINDNVYR